MRIPRERHFQKAFRGSMLSRITSTTTVFGWLFMTVAAMAAFWNYEATPGERTSVAAHMPPDSRIPFASNRKSLLIFIHPKCACSKATLVELRTLLAGLSPDIIPACTFLLRQPADPGQAWRETAHEQDCREFRGGQVLDDYAGAEATRFGVKTSGTCLLYDEQGRLLFAGGLTASRGHIGPTASQARLKELLRSVAGVPEPAEIRCVSCNDCRPVFGCPLFSAAERPDSE